RGWIFAAEQTLRKMLQTFEHVYVIGFSMGGMIASYLAARYDVAKLVLLAPSGKYLSWKRLMLDVFGCFVDGVKGQLHNNKWYLRYKNKLRSVHLRANLEFFKLVRFTRFYLTDMDKPVLIAQGKQDGLVPYKTPYYLVNKMISEQKNVVV